LLGTDIPSPYAKQTLMLLVALKHKRYIKSNQAASAQLQLLLNQQQRVNE